MEEAVKTAKGRISKFDSAEKPAAENLAKNLVAGLTPDNDLDVVR